MIHGQFPVTVWEGADDAENDTGDPDRLCLYRVPLAFKVVPLIGSSAVKQQLSSNFSAITALAGIFQVLFGSIEIYHAWNRQIPHFGYAAYSLTVVPYLLMSVINLVSRTLVPEYPTMFLVRYGGLKPPAEINTEDDGASLLPLKEAETERSSDNLSWTEPELSGTVGVVYGDLRAPSSRYDLSRSQLVDILGLYLHRARANYSRFTILYYFWSQWCRMLSWQH